MKKIIACLLGAAMLISFAACTKTEVPTPSATPTSLERIKAAGKIVLLTNATFPPFEYIEGNGFAGVDIDIGQAIADKLGVELEVIDMNFDILPDALNADKGDFVAAGMTITEEKKQVVNFTKEYVVNGLMVIIPIDSEYKNFDDLAGLKIAAQEATTGDYFATDNIDTPDENVLRFKGMVEAGQSVISGRADAAIIDKLTAQSIVAASPDKIKLMEGVLEEEMTAIAVKKGNDDLLEFIQDVLDELESQGKIQEFIDHHMVAALD